MRGATASEVSAVVSPQLSAWFVSAQEASEFKRSQLFLCPLASMFAVHQKKHTHTYPRTLLVPDLWPAGLELRGRLLLFLIP